MNHQIILDTEVEGAEPFADLLGQVIPAALAAEGVDVPCEVDVLFTDDGGIHAINLEPCCSPTTGASTPSTWSSGGWTPPPTCSPSPCSI